jgi:stage II sporulation protein AA (anti-sigma F factor antagonist)
LTDALCGEGKEIRMDESFSSLLSVERVNDGIHVVKLLANQAVDELPLLKMEEGLLALVDAGARRIVVDFSDVDHFSSSGLGMLLNIKKYLEDKKGALRLCHIKPDILKVFKITRLSEVFSIHKTAKGALASFDE